MVNALYSKNIVVYSHFLNGPWALNYGSKLILEQLGLQDLMIFNANKYKLEYGNCCIFHENMSSNNFNTCTNISMTYIIFAIFVKKVIFIHTPSGLAFICRKSTDFVYPTKRVFSIKSRGKRCKYY